MATLVLDQENFIAGFSKSFAKRVITQSAIHLQTLSTRPDDDKFEESMSSEISISYDVYDFMNSAKNADVPQPGLSKLPTIKDCEEGEQVEEFDKETLNIANMISKEPTPKRLMMKSNSEKGNLTISDDASISNFIDDDDLSCMQSRRATESNAHISDFKDDVN
jgi:hypothetical protein